MEANMVPTKALGTIAATVALLLMTAHPGMAVTKKQNVAPGTLGGSTVLDNPVTGEATPLSINECDNLNCALISDDACPGVPIILDGKHTTGRYRCKCGTGRGVCINE